jgi:hypothetical protein
MLTSSSPTRSRVLVKVFFCTSQISYKLYLLMDCLATARFRIQGVNYDDRMIDMKDVICPHVHTRLKLMYTVKAY